MRPHLVVFLAEPAPSHVVAPADWLLAAGYFLLQRAMHPLMPSILLRVPRFNPLRHDPQLHPPHRQARQPSNGMRCKRCPIVGSDRLRHSILAKRRFKDRLHSRRVRLLHRLAPQQIPAMGIGDRQRIDPLPSPVRNQPLKSAHHTRFGPSACASGSLYGAVAAVSAAHHQPFPFQQRSDRARRRPHSSRLVIAPALASTSAAPSSCALLADPAPSARSPPASGSIPLRRSALLPQPFQPHCSDTASDHTYPVSREISYRSHSSLIVRCRCSILKYKPQFLFHHTALFPWHPLFLTHACHRCSVRDVPGLFCQGCARSVPDRHPTPLYPLLLKTKAQPNLDQTVTDRSNSLFSRYFDSESRCFPLGPSILAICRLLIVCYQANIRRI